MKRNKTSELAIRDKKQTVSKKVSSSNNIQDEDSIGLKVYTRISSKKEPKKKFELETVFALEILRKGEARFYVKWVDFDEPETITVKDIQSLADFEQYFCQIKRKQLRKCCNCWTIME